jgi:membrane protease YdiL (CAAX protease family)
MRCRIFGALRLLEISPEKVRAAAYWERIPTGAPRLPSVIFRAMPTPLDHALALTLTVLFPLRAKLFGFTRLERARPEELPKVRMSVYRGAMLTQWGLVAAAAVIWAANHRPWILLGLLPVVNGGVIGVLVGLVLVVIVVVRQRGEGLAEGRTVEALRRRMARIERMMPRTPRELRAFYLLSLTAGLCEEFLYRGWMIWYLQSLGLALLPAAAISSLIFGFGHLYQGLRGMGLTAAVGGFLAAIYLITQSLYIGMLFHTLMDAHSGQMLYTVYSREDEAREAAAQAEAGT